ncbi:MAG: LysM peptidoglycan-binding domain-containing protein, partial [Acidimicrobiia bacterium]|nr:LysM peptidoglycan-binding domain-containing protein [Acidimicrobiia bacterium]
PLVAGPVNALAVRLVSGIMAASVAVATASSYLSLPAAPTMAETAPAVVDPASARAGREPTTSDPQGPRWLVRDGDSLWSIAEATLGDGGRSAELLTLNPELTPRAVEPGVVLLLPVGAAVPTDRLAPAPAPELVDHLPAAHVEIVSGDNLWHLSDHRLQAIDDDPDDGDIARYVETVVDRNDERIDDPDLIFPGQVFTFPAVGPEPPLQPAGATRPEARSEAPVVPQTVARDAVPARSDQTQPATGGANPSQPGGGDRRDPVDGVDLAPDEPPSVVVPVLLGAAGGLLAAGALDLVRRRRRFRLAHRGSGRVPSPPAPELAPIELALQRQADPETRAWLCRAVESLTSRPVWEGEVVAQPLIARLDTDRLEVEFSEADPMAAPVPWVKVDDGRRWRLDRAIPIDQLPGPDVTAPIPSLVTLGVDLLVNLEGLGVVEVAGEVDLALGLVRSIIHELATSPAAGSIDVRTTVPIAGSETYSLVRRQSPAELVAELPPWLDDVSEQLARRSWSSAYTHRLAADADPLGPVVVVTDAAGADAMPAVLEHARRRSLPLAVVVVGARTSGSMASIELEREAGRLEPWGVEFESQLLDGDVARQLGELLLDAAEDREEPLVTGVQLSASITELRHHRRSATGSDGPPEPPGAAATDDAVDEGPRDDGADEIQVQLLGDVEVSGPAEPLTSQQLSLLCYLACNGSSSREAIIDALWDGQVISKSRFPNLLAETRARIGRHHFPEARDGRYELSGVTTDLARFERAVLSAQRQEPAEAAATLRSALELVRGVPLEPPARRFWSWVGDHTHVAARIESMVADTAVRLARLEQERGQLDGARWACEQGLLASPTDENLVIVLTEVYVALGKPGLARRLVDNWEDRISSMDCGEPSDEPRKRLAG